MSDFCLLPAQATDPGRSRPRNEDAVLGVYPQDAHRRQMGPLFLVADGVGGKRDGDLASAAVAGAFADHFYQQGGQATAAALKHTINALNVQVYTHFQKRSATTLTAAVFYADAIIIAHVGDSRAYWLQGGHITRLTTDHTHPVTQANGRVKHKLTRAIGHAATVEIDIRQVPAVPGGRLLLVTDGATRYLSDEQMAQMIAPLNPAEAVQALIDAANAAGGADNISAVVVDVLRPCPDEASARQHIHALNAPVTVAPPPAFTPAPPPIPEPAPRRGGRAALIGVGGMVALLLVAVGLWAVGIVPAPVVPASPTPTLTALPTLTDLPTATMPPTLTTVPTAAPTTEPLVIGPNVTITFEASTLTVTRIGEPLTAFTVRAGAPYRITQDYQGPDGQSWYRLFDPETERYGWINANDLPGYQLSN